MFIDQVFFHSFVADKGHLHMYFSSRCTVSNVHGAITYLDSATVYPATVCPATPSTDKETGIRCLVCLLYCQKSKETYLRFLGHVKSWINVDGQNWQVDSFLFDFEKGPFLAVAEVFPGIVSEDCYFHLAKRLAYHVKSLGLMEKYKNDADFRLRVTKLAALAFVMFRMLSLRLSPMPSSSCKMNFLYSPILIGRGLELLLLAIDALILNSRGRCRTSST